MLDGAYPDDLLADTASVTDWSFVQRRRRGSRSRVPLDVLGVNYYSTVAGPAWDGGTAPRPTPTGTAHRRRSARGSGADDVDFVPQPGPYTAMGWNIDPTGLTELLLRLHREYPGLPLMITENGAAFDDVVVRRRPGPRRATGSTTCAGTSTPSARPSTRGRRRPRLLRLVAAGQLRVGATATTARFGIIRVDYDTQERTWKDSAHWYRDVVAGGQLDD